MTPLAAIGASWTLWVISWFVAAMWSNRTVNRTSFREEARSRIVLVVGAVLLGISSRATSILPVPLQWAMFGIVVLGLAFAWWARIHLGRLWSGWITRKEDHRIVDTGPYAIVRHPIYTGVCASLLATAVAQARLLAVIGAILVTVAFTLRARLEERFLRAELGAEAYDPYARRVPMLIPFWPRTR